MADLEFDLFCPLERGLVGMVIDRHCICRRDHAVVGLGFCQRDFGLHNAGEPVLLTPDGPHLRGAVALLDGVDCHG